MTMGLHSSCRRFFMDPGKYSVFPILKKSLIVGSQAFVVQRRASLQRALKQHRNAAKAASDAAKAVRLSSVGEVRSIESKSDGASSTESEDEIEDEDDERKQERWEEELKHMRTAASELAKWGIMRDRPPSLDLKDLLKDLETIDLATAVLPRSLPAWASQHAVLAGTYWVALADDSGYYWSNGQVRDIAQAFTNKTVKRAALKYLDARGDMSHTDAWWEELRAFFKKTGQAGSGAETG